MDSETLTLHWGGVTLTGDMFTPLKTLDAALRLYAATPDQLFAARECGWLAWRPPYRFLPQVHPDIVDDKATRRWADAHRRLLGASDKPTDEAHTIILNLCARMASARPRIWARAILQTNPNAWDRCLSGLLDRHADTGWDSCFADPLLLPNVSGPALACALTDCARMGRWGAPVALRPDGHAYRIDARAWRLVERLGLRGEFSDPTPF